MCQIDWTAAGTWALAIIAFVSFWAQIFFTRKQLQEARESFQQSLAVQREVSQNEIATRPFLQMTETFDSVRMHEKRRQLAFQFIQKSPDKEIKEHVMNFFEDLGSLLRSRRLDEYLAYNAFSYHAVGWWGVCRSYVERERESKRDNTIFSQFQAFADRMIEIDAKERRVDVSTLRPGPADLETFLNEEYVELSR